MRFYYLLTCFLFQLSSASPVDTFPKVAQILPRTTDAPFEDIEREPIDVFNYTQLPKYVKHGDWTSLNCSVYETSIGGRSVWRRSTPQAWNSPERLRVYNDLSFSSFVWSMFQRNSNVALPCGIIEDSNKCAIAVGCDPRKNDIPPASTAIMNSFGALNRVKVEQWAKDSGDHRDNRLQEYQTEIHILDNNGDEAGNAARDAAEDPRVVINSNLPYQLIVNTWGGGETEDTMVEFWYSDQWWLSIDQEHKCDFKPWSHNYRTGECEFACPPAPGEGEQPPPSAIASHVPAEAPETAIPGTVTFTNWIPEPTGPQRAENYAHSSEGSGKGCGVHVNQFKHKDGDKWKFEVETYVSDSSDNVVAYTGKAFAFPGKPVPARSCQPDDPGEFCMRDFYVWVDANPKEVVSFKFKDQEWNTNSTAYKCRVGSYDGAKRQIDCGFSC